MHGYYSAAVAHRAGHCCGSGAWLPVRGHRAGVVDFWMPMATLYQNVFFLKTDPRFSEDVLSRDLLEGSVEGHSSTRVPQYKNTTHQDKPPHS